MGICSPVKGIVYEVNLEFCRCYGGFIGITYIGILYFMGVNNLVFVGLMEH